jgi:hypothetical protein
MCAFADGVITYSHVETARKLHTVRIRQERQNKLTYILRDTIALSPNGILVARLHSRGQLSVLDLKEGKTLYTTTVHEDTPEALAFHPSGQLLAIGGATSRQRITLGHSANLQGAYPPETYTVKLLEAATGVQLQTLETTWRRRRPFTGTCSVSPPWAVVYPNPADNSIGAKTG